MEHNAEQTHQDAGQILEESDVENSVDQQVVEEFDRLQISRRPVCTRILSGHLADYISISKTRLATYVIHTLVKLLSLAFSNHEWRGTFLWVSGLREEVQQPLATVPPWHWDPLSPLLPLLHLSWRPRFCAPKAHWATTSHCPPPRQGQESQAVPKWRNSATFYTSCPWTTSIGCLPYPWGGASPTQKMTL